MLIGYARVSTVDQNPALQRDALTAGGLRADSRKRQAGQMKTGHELAAALDHMRKGDTLVGWKLDRLARSMKQLIETVGAARSRWRQVPLDHGKHRHGLGRGPVRASHLRRLGGIRALPQPRAHERRIEGCACARPQGRAAQEHDGGGCAGGGSAVERKLEPTAVAQRMGVSRATLYRHLKQANDAARS